MSLDAAARRRYARQVLLGEIGEAGQERLLQVRFRAGANCDADALRVAVDYLERAGCHSDPAGDELVIPKTESVDRFAASPVLREAAASIVGSFAAVEHIKQVLGVGTARAFPDELKLSTEG